MLIENVICERMTNRKEGKDRFEQNLRKFAIKVYREINPVYT